MHIYKQRQSAAPCRIVDRTQDPDLPGPVFLYGAVSSTLDVARSGALAAPPWASIVAQSQEGGRGQLRRPWASPPGNLYAALRLPWEEPFCGTACAPAVGAMMAAALRHMGLNVFLKWPNDIVLWQGQEPCKVGGILIEEHQHEIWAGMGLNRASSPPQHLLRPNHALRASHIHALFPHWPEEGAAGPLDGEEFHNVAKLWLSLVKNAFSWYQSPLPVQDRWRPFAEECLLWRGQQVMLWDEGHDSRPVRGILLGLGSSGGVRLQQGSKEEEFFSGSLRAC